VFNIGPLELMVILVIALLVVGPKRLPEVGRSIGKGLREFRRAQDEVTRTIRLGIDEEPDQPTTPTAAGTADTGGAESGSAPPAAGAASTSGSDATTDAVRTLGRSLAELRRAREKLQRSFRVDLTGPPPAPRTSRPVATPAPAPEPSAVPQPPADPSADPD
jgi:TatA/E family protein of Tat protein translocase